MTKILLKAKEIKRMKHWDVNTCFPIHLVIKRDFSQALMDKQRLNNCVVSEGILDTLNTFLAWHQKIQMLFRKVKLTSDMSGM